MLYHHEDYRDILQLRFDQRHGRNPAYSLRAYARDLKISPSQLSEVLSRRHHLSATVAESIGKQLAFDDAERAFFKDLVESQTGRTEASRVKARTRLLKFRFDDADTRLKLDQFKAIADWYHFAILELFKTKSFRNDVKWIAKALKITPKVAKNALERLERLGFVEKAAEGFALKRVRSFTDSDTPQGALRDYQKQLLDLAASALHTQTKAERVTLSAIAAIDRESLGRLRVEVNTLVGDFVTKSAKQQDADNVYCMTVQIFKLDDGGDGREQLT